MGGFQAFDLSSRMDIPQTFFLESFVEYFLQLLSGQSFYLFDVIDENFGQDMRLRFVFFSDLFSQVTFRKSHDIEDVGFDGRVFFLESLFLILNNDPPGDEIEKEQKREAHEKEQAIGDE
jgi:hypothetical protein